MSADVLKVFINPSNSTESNPRESVFIRVYFLQFLTQDSQQFKVSA